MNKPTADKSGPTKGATTNAAGIAEWIKDHIRHGKFVPGQRLVEGDIVAATGANRAKVREAFHRLEIEGLIEMVEFKGVSVKRLSFSDVEHLYKTRMVLEGLAAAELAGKDAPELKARLAELQEQMNDWEDQGDHERYARLNGEWHTLIIKGSENPFVAQFLSQLTVPIYRLLFASFYKTQRIKSANADHREITKAIIDGRVDDAERAMRQHIKQGLSALSDFNPDYFT